MRHFVWWCAVMLWAKVAAADDVTVHPATVPANATSRVMLTLRHAGSPATLTTGEEIAFIVRSNAPSGGVTLTNPGTVIVTSDPAALGLQGSFTTSLSGSTISLTYTAGATNRFNGSDIVAIAVDVTPSPNGPNGGEYPVFVNGVSNNGGISGGQATLAFVGFPSGPTGPQGAQGPSGPQGLQGPAGLQGLQGIQGIQGAQGTPGVSVTGAAEPAGTNCVVGGVALTSASGINYVCNGTMGTPGAMGDQGPAGTNGEPGQSGGCATGNAQSSGSMIIALGLLLAMRKRQQRSR